MIHFRDVSKSYHSNTGHRVVLLPSSFDLDIGHNYGILGANGSGKSTLIRMISGAVPPTRGRIHKRVRVSFPLGFSGTFNGFLTGRQNAAFLARVYGENVRKVQDYVWDFSELGTYFDMPFHTYSSGMRAKFALGLSLAIDFDVYLVDEITEVGDARFRAKCADVFKSRASRSDIIMVSHSEHTIKAYCDRAAVLHEGVLTFFENVPDAMNAHSENMRQTHVTN